MNEDYCRVHLGSTPGPYVLLAVSDNGSGMDKETLQNVFEPFFTTKEIGKGTGLGLATVYGIVQQNNGFINVYSEQGQGTTFKIYLPRSMDGVEVSEEILEQPVALGSGKILLVEDDDLMRKMTTDMLKTIGYSVLAVGSPLEALSICEEKDARFDLVITDVVMPGMSGRELRDKLGIIRPDIKVLFMSGYTSNVIVHHGVLEEGVHFIQKPFSLNDFARKIQEAMTDR
jgi:CheY-like chemotaxis protein